MLILCFDVSTQQCVIRKVRVVQVGGFAYRTMVLVLLSQIFMDFFEVVENCFGFNILIAIVPKSSKAIYIYHK